MRTISSYAQTGLLGAGALASAYGLGAHLSPGVVAGTVVMGSGIALMAFERLNRLRQERAVPIPDGDVLKAAASALKRDYPVLEQTDYSGLLSGMAKKVADEWAAKKGPALTNDPIVHSQAQRLIDLLAAKSLNEKQKALLGELRKDAKAVRARALEPWKALLLPGGLAAGVAFMTAAGLRAISSPSVDSGPLPDASEAVCRRTFAPERFSARPEKLLPLPSKMAFVPAWMKTDAKARQAWILSRFVPAYLDYFECRWTERLNLQEGLRLMDEILEAWKGKEILEIPARLEGDEASGIVTIAPDLFRQALEDKILKKYPELSLHRAVSEVRSKNTKRGVQGPDVPQVGRSVDYEGFTYAHLGTRVVRWPQDSQKIALEKELWDAPKGDWVKCLSKEAKP